MSETPGAERPLTPEQWAREGWWLFFGGAVGSGFLVGIFGNAFELGPGVQVGAIAFLNVLGACGYGLNFERYLHRIIASFLVFAPLSALGYGLAALIFAVGAK
jgi:hypothetical protein